MLKTMDRLAKFSWFVLLYNLFVIVWGGFVRASGSGAGCGAHWPLCNGVVVPRAVQLETIIEFTHRVTSGLTVVFILGMCIWVWRKYPKSRVLRWTSGASVFFIFTESLLGASLVLLELVAYDDSLARAFFMMTHLVNTMLLLASIALTAWFITTGSPLKWQAGGKFRIGFIVGILGMFVLGASGAITALGDTLFPSATLAEGIQREFADTAHYLLRLRIYHPPIAILVGLFAASYCWRLQAAFPSPRTRNIARILIGLVLVQFGLGFVNVILLAPIWLQLVHLLMTTLIWIAFVLTSISGLVASHFTPGVREEHVQHRVEQPAA
jgi:heme A synthase